MPDAYPDLVDPTGPDRWGRLMGMVATSGVNGDPGTAVLQAYRTGSGLFVRYGHAYVLGHAFVIDSAEGDQQVTVPANASGSTRLDRLVIRRNPAVSGGEPALTYLTGSSTAYPSLSYNEVGNYDVSLAMCQVPSGSSVPSSVTDDRYFLGRDIIPCTSVTQIPVGRRRIGTIAADGASLRWWDGAEWERLHQRVDSGWVTSGVVYASGWTAQTGYQPAVRNVDGLCSARGAIRYSSGTLYGRPLLTFPVGYRPKVNTWLGAVHSSAGSGGFHGTWLLEPDGQLWFPEGYGEGSLPAGTVIPLAGSWYVD